MVCTVAVLRASSGGWQNYDQGRGSASAPNASVTRRLSCGKEYFTFARFFSGNSWINSHPKTGRQLEIAYKWKEIERFVWEFGISAKFPDPEQRAYIGNKNHKWRHWWHPPEHRLQRRTGSKRISIRDEYESTLTLTRLAQFSTLYKRWILIRVSAFCTTLV